MKGVWNSTLSLTPDSSRVRRAVKRDETVSTVSAGANKTVETVFTFPDTPFTPLKRGVNERRLA
jgi:hypothetical protein